MDNLPAHKAGIAGASADSKVLFLSPYSPDMDPIKQIFATLKALLCQARARIIDALWAGSMSCPTA
jgi:transposase